MGNLNGWLKARERHKALLAKIQKIFGGGIIAALIIGPLIYFSVCAEPSAEPLSERFGAQVIQTTGPATPEVKTSAKPIEFPTEKSKEDKIREEFESGKVDLNIELLDENVKADLSGLLDEREVVAAAVEEDVEEFKKNQLEQSFNKKDVEIKSIKKEVEGFEEEMLIMENVDVDFGPREVTNDEDANSVSRNIVNKYIQAVPNKDKIAVYKDTSKLKQSNKKIQIVLSEIKHHASKWYVTFQQYQDGLPVFDGTMKLVFTEKKKLLVLTDNLKYDIPETTEFTILESEAQAKAKEAFEWNDEIDEIEFVNKGYFKNKPTYRIDTNVHNPLGEWEVYVNGTDGEIENLYGNIRLQDTYESLPEDAPEDYVFETNDEGAPLPYNPGISSGPVTEASDELPPEFSDDMPEPEPPASGPVSEEPLLEEGSPEGIVPPPPSSTPEEIVQPEPKPVEVPAPAPIIIEESSPATPEAFTELLSEFGATADLSATQEPAILVIDTFFSQILGKIYPKTPADTPIIEPFADEYAYIDTTQVLTDDQGYFENPSRKWYSVFLDGPYVTVHDDDATSNVEIKDKTPEDPFVWDENSASLAAINAFYHTNKIREYFAETHAFEMNDNIPVTVNSELVDQYIEGCGAWFDNASKTIEMGRGGTEFCPDELNYALSSDLVYHEYTHFIVEDITHLPNIPGTESAALGEGLADYFAASINNDSLWGDVVSPSRTRNLDNTLNYQTDMNGQAHHDGQIFSGALWDLREEIGAETTDKLVFNTLYQDRLHFETFMYGMIIEDDDNEDFSDGTPHLIKIIEAFENHGIGPGVENFSGLPIDPEEWSRLLEEEYPEGEEEPLQGAYISGDCYWSSGEGSFLYSGSGYCYIRGGGTLTATGFWSESGSTTYLYEDTTFDVGGQSLIQGTVQLGSTTTYGYYDAYGEQIIVSSGSLFTVLYDDSRFRADELDIAGTLRESTSTYYSTANSLDINNNGYVDVDGDGLLDINGTTTVDAGGTLNVDSGGNFDTNALYQGEADGSPLGGTVTVSGDVDVYGNAYLFDGGILTVNSSSGNFYVSTNFYIGDTDGSPAGGHVENYDYIYVAGTTYLYENTGGTSEGDVDNNSGAAFYTNNLYLGDNTVDEGGNFENDGYMNVYNAAYVYDNGYLNIDTAGTNSYTNYLRIYNGGFVSIASSAELNQDYSSGYVILNDDCDLDNSGTLDIDGYLSLSGGTSSSVRPELYNTSSGIVQVASYVSMSNYADILTYNDFSVTTNVTANNYSTIRNYELFDVNGTLYLYDASTLTNNTGGNLQVYEDLYLGNSTGDTAYLNNYATVTVDGSTSNYFFVYYNTSVTNRAAGVINVDSDATASNDGKIYLYSASSSASDTPLFDNYGTINTASLQIGYSNYSLSHNTVFNNYNGAVVNVDYSGTSFNAFRIEIEGTFNNNSGAELDVDGQMDITGGNTTSYDALLDNDSTLCTVDGSSSIGEYGHIDNSGTCVIYNNLAADTSNGSFAYTINNTSQFTVLDYLTLSSSSTVNNATDSYFYVYDGIIMNDNTIMYNKNATLTVDNLVNSNAYVTLNDSTRIDNTDEAGSTTATSFTVDGTVNIYDTARIRNNNDGTASYDEVAFVTDKLNVGYWNSSVDYREGGSLSMGEEADVDVIDTGSDAMEVYNGGTSIYYYSGDTVNDFDVAGTATFRGASDWSTNYAWFNNYQRDTSGNTVSFGGLILEEYAKFDSYSASVATTVVNGNVQITGGQFEARQYSFLDVSGNLSVSGSSGDENGRLYLYNTTSDVDVDGAAGIGSEGLMDIRGDLWVAGNMTVGGSNAHLLATYPVNRDDGSHTTYGSLGITNAGDVDLNSGSNGTRFKSLAMHGISTGAPTLDVAAGVTLYLTGSHTGSTQGYCSTGNCSIEMNTEHSVDYDAIIGVLGEIDVAETADDAYIVMSSTVVSAGTAKLYVYGGGLLDVNETGGEVFIDTDGHLWVYGTSPSEALADIEMDVEIQDGGALDVGFDAGVLSEKGDVDINGDLWVAGIASTQYHQDVSLSVSGTTIVENGGELQNYAGTFNNLYQDANITVQSGGLMEGDSNGTPYDSYFYFGLLENAGTVNFGYNVDGRQANSSSGGVTNFGSNTYAGSTPDHNIGRSGSGGGISSSGTTSVTNIYSNVDFTNTGTGYIVLATSDSGKINVMDTSTAGVYSYLDLNGGDMRAISDGDIEVEGRIVNANYTNIGGLGGGSYISFANPDSSVDYYNTIGAVEIQHPTTGLMGTTSSLTLLDEADVRIDNSRTCGSYTCSIELGTDTLTGSYQAVVYVATGSTLQVEDETEDVVVGEFGKFDVYSTSIIYFLEDSSTARMRMEGTITTDGGFYVQMPMMIENGGYATIADDGYISTDYCALIGDNGTIRVLDGGDFHANTDDVACPLTAEGASATDGLTVLSGVTTDGKLQTDASGASDVDWLGDFTVYGDADIGTTVWPSGNIYNKNGGEIVLQAAGGNAHLRGTDYDHENGAYLEAQGDTTVTLWGTATFDGEALIAGDFDCTDNLTIDTNAVGADRVIVDGPSVLTYGVVTVNGSTTDVYGEMELDGVLNAGDLTVYNGGRIFSGEGIGGGQTLFLINADSVDVQTGGGIGNLAADANSGYGSHTGAGSYGGEGEGRGALSGGTTYGRVKMVSSGAPYFGEAGNTGSGAVDGYGGGAVRMVVTGDINIDGYVSSDGGTGTTEASGAGGSVIIIHDIDHTDTAVTFTGDGYISADGGNSSTTGVDVGGGGRIAIYSILLDYPDDGGTSPPSYEFDASHITATPGYNSTDGDYAAAGTIAFLDDDNNSEGSLLIRQGGTIPSGIPTPQTFIPHEGVSDAYEFDRVEASGNARVEYESTPTVEPTSCYELSSSVVAGLTDCAPYADKPHILFINNSYTGAQSGTEPYVGGPVDPQDITPNFSIIYVNPEDSSAIDKIQIQVDDSSDFSSPIWDYTKSGITQADSSTVLPGERTADVTYNEDSTGSALTTSTPYYVRVRFLDSSSNAGLWNHKDMGNHYNFEITDYMSLSDGCSGAMDIKDTNAAGRPAGNNLKDTDGDRYGFDACTITADSTLSTSQILYGMAPGETGFTDGTYVLDPVADCTIDTDGTSPPASEEEYGFVLKNVDISFTVPNDTECSSQPFNSWAVISDGEYQYLHDIEASGSEDQILTSATTLSSTTFDLETHASIDTYTLPVSYALDTRLIITTNP